MFDLISITAIISGNRVEITQKRIARQVADALFDEIVSFRDRLAPNGGQAERNIEASKTIAALRTKKCQAIVVPRRNRLARFLQLSTRNSQASAECINLSDLSSREFEQITEAQKNSEKATLNVIPEGSELEEKRHQPAEFRNELKHAAPYESYRSNSGHSSTSHSSGHSITVSEPDCDMPSHSSEGLEDLKTEQSIRHTLDEAWDVQQPWDSASAAHSLMSDQSPDREQIQELDVMIEREAIHQKSRETEAMKKEHRKQFQFLSREMIEIFLGDQTDEFMEKADRGCGLINYDR